MTDISAVWRETFKFLPSPLRRLFLQQDMHQDASQTAASARLHLHILQLRGTRKTLPVVEQK